MRSLTWIPSQPVFRMLCIAEADAFPAGDFFMNDVDAQKEQDVLKRLASENASLARQAAFDAGDMHL